MYVWVYVNVYGVYARTPRRKARSGKEIGRGHDSRTSTKLTVVWALALDKNLIRSKEFRAPFFPLSFSLSLSLSLYLSLSLLLILILPSSLLSNTSFELPPFSIFSLLSLYSTLILYYPMDNNPRASLFCGLGLVQEQVKTKIINLHATGT